MKELLVGIFGNKKQTKVEVPVKSVEYRPRRVYNPIAEPDLARTDAFRIPGVLNGTLITQETEEGIWETDFDHRDNFGNFTRKFTPKPGYKITTVRVAAADETVYVQLAPDVASK